MSIKTTLPKSDSNARRLLLDAIRALPQEKAYRAEILELRPRRSDRQNRYYWPEFVQPFAEWLTAEWGRTVDELEAHGILKDEFLRVPEVNVDGEVIFRADGNPLMRTRGSSELNTLEFNLYLDSCAEFLWDWCRIRVPEPNVYREAA